MKRLLTNAPQSRGMRSLLVLCAFAAMAGAAFAAPPPGVYDFQDQPDPQACAHVCADDSLCVAWTFGGAGKCALMAAAPREPAEGWVSGISPNAPSFVRAAAAAPITAAPTSPAPEASRQADVQPETGAETALLGGPDDGSLRTRLQ